MSLIIHQTPVSSPGTDLPFCGPLEGLALMYILREQVLLQIILYTLPREISCTRIPKSGAGLRQT